MAGLEARGSSLCVSLLEEEFLVFMVCFGGKGGAREKRAGRPEKALTREVLLATYSS